MHQLRQHIERVVPLTEQEFAGVLARFSCQQFNKRQVIVQVGQPVNYNYFVVQGLLKLLYTDEAGKQHFLSFAMEDWWETDFAAYYSATPATLSLECVEDTTRGHSFREPELGDELIGKLLFTLHLPSTRMARHGLPLLQQTPPVYTRT